MWRILPGLVGQTGNCDDTVTQGTPLLLSRRHPQLLVIAPGSAADVLLAGAGEKQTAQAPAASPHTVHVYVKQLYKHYGISSRGELLALRVSE